MNIKIIDSETAAVNPLQGQPQAIAGLYGQTGDLSSVPVELSIGAVERDAGLQARVELDQATIDSYADEMKQGATFPPITVIKVRDSARTRYLLADGFHRLKASLQNGESYIQANVIEGTRQDALKCAASANTQHGLRRSNPDKRKAVEILLRDQYLGKYGDRKIGKLAGVDHKTVGSVRAVLVASGEIPQMRTQEIVRQGKKYAQRTKGKEATSQNKQEPQDPGGPSVHLPQAEDGESLPDGSPQPGPAVPSARDPQFEHADDQGITAAPRDSHEGLAESPEGAAQDEDKVGSDPEASARDGQPEPEDSLSDTRPETQASQAPVLALYHLLKTVEDGVSDFRVQHVCDKPVIEKALGSLEGGAKCARYILESDDQPTGDGGDDLDAEERLTPEPDATMAPDDPGVQGHLSPLEEAPTTGECLNTFDVVQIFMKRRCMSSTDPVSHDDVMASIKTWLGSQGLPLLTEKEVIDALHGQKFRDEKVTGGHRERTASSYQWQGFQLLPSGAPDNEVDPFGSRHT